MNSAYRTIIRILLLCGMCTICLGAFSPDLSWYTIDGGGDTSSGNSGTTIYTISGTIGQPDAGVLSGGTYNITGGFWAGLTPPPITIVQWRSVRDHAGTPLPIVLKPAASGTGLAGPAVETRQGGIQKIEIDFSDPISLANSSAIQVTGQTTTNGVIGPVLTYNPNGASVSGNTLTLTFPVAPASGFLPDQTCYHIELAGAVIATQGQLMTGDTDCSVRALVGDATGDGFVTLSDAVLVKLNAGAAVATHPEWDTDHSGTINLTDALINKSFIFKVANSAICP